MKICPIEHRIVHRKFAKDMRSSRVAIAKEDTDTRYLAVFQEDNPIGVVGWLYMSDSHVRFKTDYVQKAFRGIGVYSNLFKSRLITILMDEKVDTITAYCTEMSLPSYLKNGFEVQSVGKNGITYVKLKINR